MDVWETLKYMALKLRETLARGGADRDGVKVVIHCRTAHQRAVLLAELRGLMSIADGHLYVTPSGSTPGITYAEVSVELTCGEDDLDRRP